jgi:hypothetical protein
MYPLVSAQNLTPNSTGESAPASTIDGTAVLGQICAVLAYELEDINIDIHINSN